MSESDGGPFRLMASINLDLHEILVVGGGNVALRKIETLMACGARVKMVAPEAVEALADMAADRRILWERRLAEEDDFVSHSFALLAVPPDESGKLVPMARKARCAVDVCADGASGDFALCAQFEAEGCFIGVSSGGRNPACAASLKRDILKTFREPLTVLTRKSPLARAQAGMWLEALESAGCRASLEAVVSDGDRDRTSELSSFGFGAFVKALENELLRGRGDCAVHSMKDVPTSPAGRCALAAVLKRGSVRDVLVTRDGGGLETLPAGAKVGTSSVRRRAQLRHLRSDIDCVKCRGNVGTRIDRLLSGEVDALVLAEAGLERLGITYCATPLPFVASAGQGAVVAETVKGSRAEKVLRSLNHVPTWYEVSAEREFLSRLASGCVCPVGVNARYASGALEITAEVYPMEPGPPERGSVRGSVRSECDAAALADELWSVMSEGPLVKAMAMGEHP